MVLYTMSKTLEKIQIRDPSKDRISRPIPYPIHQTFKTNVIPDSMFQAANSYITLNPHYDYYFYGDEDIQAIVDSFDCSGLAFTNVDL
jgi:mannosyltransferase OCH1-like enzyme